MNKVAYIKAPTKKIVKRYNIKTGISVISKAKSTMLRVEPTTPCIGTLE